MSKRPIEPTPRWAAIVLSLALLTLLVVVAIGARRIPSASGDSQLPLDSRMIGQIVAYVVWALMAVTVIWLMLPGGARRRRRVVPKRRSWMATTLVLIALLIVFMQLGKLNPNPSGEGEEMTTLTQPEIRDTTVVSAEPHETIPAGSATTLLIVIGAVIVTVAALAAVGRTREEEPVETPTARPALRGVLDDLLADLERSGDPRLIVIGAYARMEQVLARDGLARRRAEAPLEFLDRALRHLYVSAGAVRRLTDLFSEARFSPHMIKEDMSVQAIEALRQVRDELQSKI